MASTVSATCHRSVVSCAPQPASAAGRRRRGAGPVAARARPCAPLGAQRCGAARARCNCICFCGRRARASPSSPSSNSSPSSSSSSSSGAGSGAFLAARRGSREARGTPGAGAASRGAAPARRAANGRLRAPRARQQSAPGPQTLRARRERTRRRRQPRPAAAATAAPCSPPALRANATASPARTWCEAAPIGRFSCRRVPPAAERGGARLAATLTRGLTCTQLSLHPP